MPETALQRGVTEDGGLMGQGDLSRCWDNRCPSCSAGRGGELPSDSQLSVAHGTEPGRLLWPGAQMEGQQGCFRLSFKPTSPGRTGNHAHHHCRFRWP